MAGASGTGRPRTVGRKRAKGICSAAQTPGSVRKSAWYEIPRAAPAPWIWIVERLSGGARRAAAAAAAAASRRGADLQLVDLAVAHERELEPAGAREIERPVGAHAGEAAVVLLGEHPDELRALVVEHPARAGGFWLPTRRCSPRGVTQNASRKRTAGKRQSAVCRGNAQGPAGAPAHDDVVHRAPARDRACATPAERARAVRRAAPPCDSAGLSAIKERGRAWIGEVESREATDERRRGWRGRVGVRVRRRRTLRGRKRDPARHGAAWHLRDAACPISTG